MDAFWFLFCCCCEDSLSILALCYKLRFDSQGVELKVFVDVDDVSHNHAWSAQPCVFGLISNYVFASCVKSHLIKWQMRFTTLSYIFQIKCCCRATLRWQTLVNSTTHGRLDIILCVGILSSVFLHNRN